MSTMESMMAARANGDVLGPSALDKIIARAPDGVGTGGSATETDRSQRGVTMG